MPPVEDLENPNYKFATEIFSEDGKVLGLSAGIYIANIETDEGYRIQKIVKK